MLGLGLGLCPRKKVRVKCLLKVNYHLILHCYMIVIKNKMVQMYPNLPSDISFLTGKGILKRNLPVQPLHDTLGQKCASAILGFQALTGSDLSGRCAGKTKVFMACDDNILNALESLGYTTSWNDSSANYTSPKCTPK